MLVYRFQTNDKPWSDAVLPQDLEAEYRRRLRVFLGPFHLREQGDEFGPYLKRSEAIHRAVTRLTAETNPGLTVFVANKAGKGVRAQVIRRDQPWGPIFHTTGPCKDNYPNIVTTHSAGGQILKGQEPAVLAFLEAERLNGRPIRISGMGWRSCAEQSNLYYHGQPPGRFANPADSRHCRGLAFDIWNTADNLTRKAKEALESVGFIFGVSGEPWHCAYQEAG